VRGAEPFPRRRLEGGPGTCRGCSGWGEIHPDADAGNAMSFFWT
jgi:hypothetical protein